MLAFVMATLLVAQDEPPAEFGHFDPSSWIKIAEQPNSSIYLRPDTMRKIGHNNVLFWRKTIYVKPEDKVKERLVKNVVDCSAETITIAAITSYDKKGKLISSGAIEKSKQDVDPVTPNSVSETIMNAVCSAYWHQVEDSPIANPVA